MWCSGQRRRRSSPNREVSGSPNREVSGSPNREVSSSPNREVSGSSLTVRTDWVSVVDALLTAKGESYLKPMQPPVHSSECTRNCA